jgi:hypothetical protein
MKNSGIISLFHYLPDVNMILCMMPKMATDAASSMPDTAMISVGIPFATPYPFFRSLNRQDTTTAGDTAAMTDLKH